MQAEDSCSGSPIALSGRQSPPNDIRSGSVYGCAIGQTVGSSFVFRVSDTRRQIFESNLGSLAEYGCPLDHVRQLANVARPCVSYKPCFRLLCDPGKIFLCFRGKPLQKMFSENR